MHKKKTGRNKRTLLATLLTTTFITSAYAASFDDAQARFDSGNYKQALTILEPLANNNDIEAQNLMGLIYAKGNDSSPVNDEKAVHWFHMASKQGHERASRNLAYLEANGRGSAETLSNDTADEDDCEE